MKKIIRCSLVALLALSSCKREGISRNVYTGTISIENAIVIRKGDVVFRSGNNAGGQVAIYQLPNGKFVVGLEKMNFTSNINTELHLSNVSTKSNESVEVFAFRAVNGSLYNRVPSHINIADFKYAIIQNDREEEAIASAELQ
jgi:hypothetical protein